jgi:nucleoside-diphosphate-sugar epimerase
MTVLVTGGTGFIGSQVVRALLAGGHKVRVAARTGASRERLTDVAARIEWAEADLFAASPGDLRALCSGVDLCVHAAWYAVPGKYLEAPENLACVTGSLALLEALAAAGVRRAAFVGTCFEYDFEHGWLSETTPLKPASLYAAAKASTRLMAEPIARARDLSFAWVRPFYQYGPFEDPRRLVPYVIGTLLRGEEAGVTRGTQVRDFLHVADVGSAIAAAATSDLTGPVNIGSGRPVTVREIVATIAAVLGREDRVRFGARPDNPTDPPFICADTRRLTAATGWAPRYGLREGLADTIEWWRARGTA